MGRVVPPGVAVGVGYDLGLLGDVLLLQLLALPGPVLLRTLHISPVGALDRLADIVKVHSRDGHGCTDQQLDALR